MKLRELKLYKLPDNSLRVKVIFPACDPEYASTVLITKGNKEYKTGKYYAGFCMTGFVKVNKKN